MVKTANRALIASAILLLHIPFLWAESIESPLNGLALNLDEEVEEYTFLLAGHLYGSPENRRSVFPSSSFLANIDRVNSMDAKFFVSLGDNYRKADDAHIANYRDSLVSKLEMPLFNSVGNHDLTDRGLYESSFGWTYHYFVYNSELFIFLDTELDAGNITGSQLDFLLNAIQNAAENPDIKNVFIFSHRLIWSVNNPDYQIVFEHLNARSGYSDTNSFENKIRLALMHLSEYKAAYWVSGDIGCSWSLPLFFDRDQDSNITYVATGIGDTDRDAILQVNISRSGDEVTFVPISLTGQKLHPIEHYGLDYWRDHFRAEDKPTWVGKRLKMFRHKYFWIGVFASWLFLGFVIFVLKRVARWF